MANRPSVRFRGLTKLTTSEIGTQFTHKVEVTISQLPNTDNTPKLFASSPLPHNHH